jgi:hypothetical protein
MRRLFVACALTAAVVALVPRAVEAIPVFAHRYGLQCQTCHTVVPHLTPFGQTFLANGYRIPGMKPKDKDAFPVALRFQATYSSAGGGGLPRTIVDEVELLTGGSVGSRGSYFVESYAVDGGFPGHTRDVWIADRLTPDGARIPVTARAGQFTLPLPIDPETFRETTDHYRIWDQTAGDNPFNFFDPKIGGQLIAGNPARQLAFTASILQGHDIQSGLPAHGLDTMFTVQRSFGDWTFSAYRYDGSRLLRGNITDRFWRNGFGAGWGRGPTQIDAIYQTGNDSAADVYGDVVQTSGGFVQLRQELGRRLFALARWDATHDTGFTRAVTGGIGYRFSRNTRLTLFDTPQRNDSGRFVHVVSSSFLVAF